LTIHGKILSKLPGSELIIAEDGSTDGTKKSLQNTFVMMALSIQPQ
jgi:hypothetical protein